MTFKNKILPFLAGAGFVLAVFTAFRTETKKPVAQPIAKPSQAPYATYIGGSGIIEARDQNISIGTSIAGVVQSVQVKVGDRAKAGQPLFRIDDRDYRADLSVKQAALVKAKASLEQAKISLLDYEDQYKLVKDVKDFRAVSADDVQKRYNALLLARAKIKTAEADVTSAEADLRASQTALERLVIRAPIDCEVLQVNIRPGEYAATGALSTPLMRVGNTDVLHVRVDIDENDAWRFEEGTRALISLRGNSDMKAELRFVRTEPYVTPKTSLTGSSSERVDTRVLEVVYAFDRKALRAYVGQQVDVFIETHEKVISAPSSPEVANASTTPIQAAQR